MSAKITRRQVAPLISATFPDYKGRTLSARVATTLTPYDLNWGGGSRNSYRAVVLDTSDVRGIDPRAPWAEPREGVEFDIPVGVVIVQRSFYCGQDCGLTFYAHPDTMPRMLGE